MFHLRRIVLTGAAVGAVVLLGTHLPAAPPRGGAPDAAITWACTCLAWATGLYLCLASLIATGCAHADRLTPPPLVARLAPSGLRRAVRVALTAGVAVGVSGAVAPALVAAAPAEHGTTVASSLDWPGLASPDPAVRPSHRGSPATVRHATPAPHRPAPPGTRVTVQPGDSLWRIAQERLGADAGSARVAAAWPRWYAANRGLIGPDPSIIRPGQRLVPPYPQERSS